jgi:predicted RNA-binding Zn-ribbon protein involved in translation (DUF1610 family)
MINMRIKTILNQHRRDFRADYECENCGFIDKDKSGYDDINFHQNVIPNMRCPKCGESSISSGANYRPLSTKYPEGYQI